MCACVVGVLRRVAQIICVFGRRALYFSMGAVAP